MVDDYLLKNFNDVMWSIIDILDILILIIFILGLFSLLFSKWLIILFLLMTLLIWGIRLGLAIPMIYLERRNMLGSEGDV